MLKEKSQITYAPISSSQYLVRDQKVLNTQNLRIAILITKQWPDPSKTKIQYTQMGIIDEQLNYLHLNSDTFMKILINIQNMDQEELQQSQYAKLFYK